MFFLTGGVGLENKIPNPAPSWLADKSWDEICRMCDLKGFKEFRQSFESSVGDWKRFYDDREPHKALLPPPWNEKLTSFQKMIVLRCLRPDKVCTDGNEWDGGWCFFFFFKQAFLVFRLCHL